MLRKILIGLGIIAILLIAAFVYMNYRNYNLSPRGVAEFDKNNLHIEINYCKPSVRGRLIFGAAADGALQPYGSYWRLGANEATEMKILQDVTFNGIPLKAGTYRLYAIPGAATFKIGVNSELGEWGYSEPDYTKDLFVTEVPVTHLDEPIEQFNIRIEEGMNEDAMVYFEWSDVQLMVPIGLN